MATDAFLREPKVMNRRFILFGRKQQENEEMGQFFGALSHLI